MKDLNSITTFSLLSSYGRTILVSLYALLIQDYDRLLSFFLEQRRWEQALALLPKLEPELVRVLVFSLVTIQLVKYASILMYNEPEGTINMLMTIHTTNRVNPRDLIPALMRCDDSKIKGAVHPVMRYLEFVIASMCCSIYHHLCLFLRGFNRSWDSQLPHWILCQASRWEKAYQLHPSTRKEENLFRAWLCPSALYKVQQESFRSFHFRVSTQSLQFLNL